VSRLPALGRRGEGWFVLQLLFLAAVGAAGFLLGPDWSGLLRQSTTVVGLALILIGLVLGLLGIRHLDRSLTPLPHPTEGGQLVDHGIYGHVRHPIYLGVLLSALGWALLAASTVALGLAIGLAVLLDLKARREEAWLRERYPDYAGYAHRTRRFVPGIY
jgi:protein-S-isoprenylcysteine O-methyltransferase Ste14